MDLLPVFEMFTELMTSGGRCCIMNARAYFSVVLGVGGGDSELCCCALHALLQVCHKAENKSEIFFMTGTLQASVSKSYL
jgi:hypothetical protein